MVGVRRGKLTQPVTGPCRSRVHVDLKELSGVDGPAQVLIGVNQTHEDGEYGIEPHASCPLRGTQTASSLDADILMCDGRNRQAFRLERR